jgi:hypothetical protein
MVELKYAYGACADADTAAHRGGRQGRLPAVDMIQQVCMQPVAGQIQA